MALGAPILPDPRQRVPFGAESTPDRAFAGWIAPIRADASPSLLNWRNPLFPKGFHYKS
jgi:hypothetical protein